VEQNKKKFSTAAVRIALPAMSAYGTSSSLGSVIRQKQKFQCRARTNVLATRQENFYQFIIHKARRRRRSKRRKLLDRRMTVNRENFQLGVTDGVMQAGWSAEHGGQQQLLTSLTFLRASRKKRKEISLFI
jgi:hypothetical protein